MEYRFRNFLLNLAAPTKLKSVAVLASIAACELFFNSPQPTVKAPFSLSDRFTYGGPAIDPTSETPAAWGAIIVDRPLFSRSRRPPALAQLAAKISELPRLSGIVITSNRKFAVFSGNGNSSLVLTEGKQIGLYRVVSITADGVDIIGQSGRQMLRIRNNAASAASFVARPPTDPTALPGGIILDQLSALPPNATTWAGPKLLDAGGALGDAPVSAQ